MSNIDGIFKDGLEQKGLEYKSGYWDDMLDILEKKRKRKLLYLFSATAVIVCTLIGLLLGMVYSGGNTKKEKNPDRLAALDTRASEYTGNNKPSGTKTENTADQIVVQNGNSENSGSNAVDRLYKKPFSEIGNEKTVTIQCNSTETDDYNKDLWNDKIQTTTFPDSELAMRFSSISGFIRMPEYRFEDAFEGIEFAKYQYKWFVNCLHTEQAKKAEWKYYISAQAQYIKYSRKEIQEQYKKDESTRTSGGFALQFSASLKQWRIRTGLGMMQISERSNYVMNRTEYFVDTIYRMVKPNYLQSNTGRFIALIRKEYDTTGIIQSSRVENANAKIHFTYLQLPLVLSYQFGNRKLKPFIDAGVQTCIRIGKKGVYTEYTDKGYILKDLKQSRDVSPLVLSTYTGAGLRYTILPDCDLTASYGLALSLHSMLKSYDQKARLGIWSFGLDWKL